jgi:Uma2 family endonuclease
MLAQEPVLIREGLAMDDFIRQFEESPFEIINGVRRTLMPNLPTHGDVVAFLFELLLTLRKSAGIFVRFEMPFVLLETSNWVKGSRVPDLMVYDIARIEAYKAANPDWGDKPYVIIPDLCIEVVSKNDEYADVMEKVESYLSDGVRLVWVFEPRTQTVTVRMAGSAQATIHHADDTLDGGAVVAGFSVRVGDVFAG